MAAKMPSLRGSLPGLVPSWRAPVQWITPTAPPESDSDRALTSIRVEHDIKTCPDAGHCFLNDRDPAHVPGGLAVLDRFTGPDFHDPSARDAWGRIIDFFDRHPTS